MDCEVLVCQDCCYQFSKQGKKKKKNKDDDNETENSISVADKDESGGVIWASILNVNAIIAK